MPTAAEIAALLELPKKTRAEIAVALIDSLGEQDWDDLTLAALAEERDAELESGAAKALSYEEFFEQLLKDRR
jgi:hypothetical protein